jgi:thiol-disulfide isomerase/thioredoxin
MEVVEERDVAVQEPEELSSDEIDETFAPRLRPNVAQLEIEGESVLLLEGTDRVHWLDQLGTIVVDCFDGAASVVDLAADISEAFGADPEAVRGDVLQLVRQVGQAGLLEGVAPVVHEYRPPSGFEPGTELPELSLPELDGGEVSLEELRGRRLLLVNWSPACGFCRKIAPDLSELQPELRAKGVDIVLLAIGEPDANRELVEEFGLKGRVLLQDPSKAEIFPGIGTPSAYLVDEAGRTASELAVGAIVVPELARSAAGRDED